MVNEKILTAVAATLAAIVGWSFTVVVEQLRTIRDRQADIVERLARVEAEVRHLENQVAPQEFLRRFKSIRDE
jgi:hypothetical protein